MRGLPTLGLRFRMVAALLAVSALTLGVAALALLPPLENRLRRDDLESLTQATSAVAPGLRHAQRAELKPHSRERKGAGPRARAPYRARA